MPRPTADSKDKKTDDFATSHLSSEIILVEAKRNALFESIQIIFEKAKRAHIDSEMVEGFLDSVATIDEIRSEFRDLVNEHNRLLLEINPSAKPNYQSLISFDDLFCRIKRVLKQVEPVPSRVNTDDDQKVIRSKRPTLAPIEIVSFDGDVRNWPLFYESYKSTIHENSSLTDAERLYYLIGKLSSKAQAVFSGIAPCPENYQMIVKCLVDRYQDKRILASTYLDQMFNLKLNGPASASNMQTFMDQYVTAANAIKILGLNDLSDFMFLHIALKKLDGETIRAFESQYREVSLPTFSQLTEFIRSQHRIYQNTQPSAAGVSKRSSGKSRNNIPNPQSYVATTAADKKCLCDNIVHDHFFKCQKFTDMSPSARFKCVKEKGACINCLSIKHKSRDCNSTLKCRNCHQKHHTLLHFNKSQNQTTSQSHNSGSVPMSNSGPAIHSEHAAPPQPSPSTQLFSAPVPAATHAPTAGEPRVSSLHTSIASPLRFGDNDGDRAARCIRHTTILLSTAQVVICDRNGQKHLVKCLLDSGSQSNFISTGCCKRLGLDYNKNTQMIVRGFGGSEKPIKGSTDFKIFSRFNKNVSFDVSGFVVDRITDDLPTVPVDEAAFTHIVSLPLADSTFATPTAVDVLLGASIFPHLLMPDTVHSSIHGIPPAIQTVLGYIIMGSAPTLFAYKSTAACCAIVKDDLGHLLRRFWELEEISAPTPSSQDDVECEIHFRTTTTRDSSGRYTVALPFRDDVYKLGDSFSTARRRFLCLEKKLESSSFLRTAYDDIIREYIEKGYVTEVGPIDSNSIISTAAASYFVPHHCVQRLDKTSTKVRMVLDASCKTSSGLSLNDVLHSGPNLQGDLNNILLKFRLFRIAISADCRQMFLQVGMLERDRKYQRFIYRFHPEDKLKVFELARVAFGMKSSVFHAIRVVHQLIADEGDRFPTAAAIASASTYMDDVCYSIMSDDSAQENENVAINSCIELIQLFKCGQFDLVKWTSNSAAVLCAIPASHRASSDLEIDKNVPDKILGTHWDKSDDVFKFKVAKPNSSCTKRNILSVVARLWDNLGLVAPVILYAKLLIQELWLLKCDWDDAPPQRIVILWRQFCSELPALNEIRVPRHLGVVQGCVANLLGFADASSTTDLTPTLIGIYDSLLEPGKSLRPEASRLETAKDARNDPPVETIYEVTEETQDISKTVDDTMTTGGVKLPITTYNKSSLYSLRTKSDNNGASDDLDKCKVFSDSTLSKVQKTFKEMKQETTFDNLSPNVKRMISSATSETTTLKFQKKTLNIGRSSMRKSNIPLVGATSKISQSGVEILSSVDIYDQPCAIKSFTKSKSEEIESPIISVPLKPEFKIDDAQTYDVPTNNRPAIYDVPVVNNKTAFESLSLPYIDQSIELSITSNDREFDIKLSSKDNSPMKITPKSPVQSPAKIPKLNEGTNSLHRKDFVNKNESPSKLLSKTVPYPDAVGSTGNLKTCEKEVIRLNPPVEVSRPLSMSSIASSSSTSSSGVQNKGGVNSAYLASIESLDDHSDVDMTSANGSNHFVNNAGIITTSVSEERNSEDAPRAQLVDELPGLSQLERVCAEIVQTENVYVEDLRQVVEGYLHVWRREVTFSDEQLNELFNNIEDIYNFNRSLCDELNTCRLDATCIARCFVNNTTGFSVYTSYCTGYPRTMERLAALASEPLSAREFRERQIALGHLLPVASYLLKPVQRILKYHLLLQNVVKQCASRETEYALLKMTGIAQHIDDMKRRHEHAVRVQEIQSLLYGWNGPDLTTYGELCAEGTFRVFGAKAMRHAFLFDKMLLVTKNREDGILAYKSHIMCNNMMLVESIAGAPLSFHVIPWDAPRAQLTLQARSPRHKREWTLLLKRVILENYNAVIPSHARQLVMELGQNKTDDDMLAEKSHNLITQASMRKQLSAPEYLEKRKLERERRKSFENGTRGRLKKGNRKYTIPSSRAESQECDCTEISAEKGIDYTCDHCYIDLCSDCESELAKLKRDDKCSCRRDDTELGEKCPECDRYLHYIDSGSAEHLERKLSACKCSDFKSSQESFSKEFSSSLTKTRGYHSSDNIIGYTDSSKSKEDLSDTNNSLSNVRQIPKTCLKCAKIKENIVTDSTSTIHSRRSRCNDTEKPKTDTLTRSKSKDDPQRSKLSKIGTWRRKSEPGLQQNMIGMISKKSQDSDNEKEVRGNEKIEFECKNCGSNKMTKKVRASDGTIISDPELDSRKRGGPVKPAVEIRMYNTKNIPKKISKLKKNRAKGLRLGSDTTAKFYADFSTDVSTENILHISESNDSLNVDKPKDTPTPVPETISKDEDIDEETYKKLIEKTDSFKKNELEKVKYLNKQKVINEGSEAEDKAGEVETKEAVLESCEEVEQPLEQIISQLLMQNREFQKLIKKQQLRNTAQRRHQRLMKSHSNPEQVLLAKNLESLKLKPKFGRQTSENLDIDKNDDEEDTTTTSSRTELTEEIDEDHIYETLRVVDKRVDESLHSLNTKSKVIQHNPHVGRPKRVPTPPKNDDNIDTSQHIGPDSDYVYLSFDKLNKLQNPEGIYDVPVRSPEKVDRNSDYYVTMESKGPVISENVYDSLIEVCRRKKEVPSDLPGDYLPMGPDQQSPNTPEIWLSRQKEHFNVSRDRKSGSLPRSFQVVTSNQEDTNLVTFKCKPNSNSKTYLNRDGKVMSTDRPFTIASDQSDINYDDMNEGDMLKFNNSKTSETDFAQNISQSTLELEEEIDRCYKSKFQDINLDKNKNENLLTVSQPNLNVSTTSSCEVLPLEQNDDTKANDIEVIHPEHKIYKPTSNMLSLKNVLSRFKNKTPNKNNEDTEINANDQSSPDSTKSDLKSPTSEKRPNLNPRSYSKNLLQRFRSIIGDEHTDDNQNKPETVSKVLHTEDIQNNLVKSDIKVVITSTDASPTTSTIVYALNNELLSKSVCEHSTLSESQNEKSNLDALSLSCDNITQKPESHRPSFEKSVSLVTSVTSSIGSPSRSNNSSYQSLNKLPIYMQGSKHLGARIAQSDYVDPTTLVSDKSPLKKVNVLINKNAVRPDSLFSNSSFVTSSSEGAYQETQNKTNAKQNISESKDDTVDSLQMNSDESYYEKSFEKIEHVTDEDMFRDSAVYSDQEDVEEAKVETVGKDKVINKTVTKVESIKRKNSFKSQKTTISTTVNEKCNTHTRVVVTTNKTANVEHINRKFEKVVKPKVAPPVPVKPKMTQIPSTSNIHNKNVPKTLSRSSEQSSSSESVNMKTIKRNVNYKPSVIRSESTPPSDTPKVNDDKMTKSDILKKEDKTMKDEVDNSEDKSKPQGNIQIKRQSFERASLDSATRKIKTAHDIKKSMLEQPKTSKSVLERRMEIEKMSKTQVKLNQSPNKPSQAAKPKSITTKVANFERSVSEISVKEKTIPTPSTDKHIPNRNNAEIKPEVVEHAKGSWVKQVVNKFQ